MKNPTGQVWSPNGGRKSEFNMYSSKVWMEVLYYIALFSLIQIYSQIYTNKIA